jgi:hypothetical protein
LEQSVAWRPSGNLIASTRRLPQRHDVVFFERNGLHHGDFALPFGPREVQVVELVWNCDSTVLALWIEPLVSPDEGQPGAYVQLWTTSNYHWYLKQEYRFKAVQGLTWDPEAAGNLAVVVDTGEFHLLRHDVGVDCSIALSRASNATVAVHDGSRLLLTTFRSQCVPPPMCSESVDIAALLGERCCTRLVTFPPTCPFVFAGPGWDGRELFAVISSHDVLAIVLSDGNVGGGPVLVAKVDLRMVAAANKQPHGLFIHQACWTETSMASSGASLVSNFLCIAWGDGTDFLVDLDIEHGDPMSNMTAKAVRFSCQVLSSPAVRLQSSDCSAVRCAPAAMLSLASGVVMSCLRTSIGGDVVLVPWVKWLAPPERVVKVTQTTSIALLAMKRDTDSYTDHTDDFDLVDLSDDEGDSDGGDGGAVDVGITDLANAPETPEFAVVTLSSAGQLCLNGHLLAANCNSFVVHDSFLIFATHSHTCHFLSTRDTAANAVATIDAATSTGNGEAGCAVRNLERGSRLVAVVPFGTRVVLQMPRGNLEVLSPRPLLLVALQAFLDRREYRRAFLLARKHRLNLNLM